MRAIIEHPDLELVGAHVHTPDKVGRDAGELCGMAATGIIATNDLAPTLALAPDCLSYMANGLGREADVCRDIVPFLEQGVDVVTCSLIPFTHPPTAPVELRDVIERACLAGGASLFNSGIDPGYATGQLAASLLSFSSEIECIRVQELGNFSRYGARDVMRDVFGFGQAEGFVPPLFTNGMVRHFWTGTVHELAGLLSHEIDDIRLVHDVALVDHDVDTAFGMVPAGSIGAVRFELEGRSRGRVVAVVEHVDRIDPTVAPQWDRAAGTTGTAYKVIVTGRPTFSCELDFMLTGGFSGAVIATATFLANAIPAICAARPGVLSMLDVAPFVGRPATVIDLTAEATRAATPERERLRSGTTRPGATTDLRAPRGRG